MAGGRQRQSSFPLPLEIAFEIGIAATSWLPTAPRSGSSLLLLHRLPTCWRRSVPRGVPQIEVTFDIEVNDILSFGALNMSKGKSNLININEKRRLSQATIDRTVLKGNKFRGEDELNKGRRKANRGLECYRFPLRIALNELLRPDRRQERNQGGLAGNVAEKEKFEIMVKEFKDVINYIMMKSEEYGNLSPRCTGACF
ncbi:unnamed protein product [Polarella glacialis]|uniref:Uncharacterized protein n=1 Tax=Polarella glacialis TaxID=89957 RepID=A0A813GDL3_POLGL|nr:unnamed protein product [Polarella glacialis]